MQTNRAQQIFRIILGAAMVTAGTGHLSFSRKEFQAQVPGWIASDPDMIDLVVLASGIAEILLGLALVFLPRHKRQLGIALAIFFVLVFPGNISQYQHQIDAFGLDTDQKRFGRLFFQPVLILWALWSTGFFNRKIAGKQT